LVQGLNDDLANASLKQGVNVDTEMGLNDDLEIASMNEGKEQNSNEGLGQGLNNDLAKASKKQSVNIDTEMGSNDDLAIASMNKGKEPNSNEGLAQGLNDDLANANFKEGTEQDSYEGMEQGIVPGTVATREGVRRGLRLARFAGAADPPDELAMDYLIEFLSDPHWSFAPLSDAACTESVRAHFSQCSTLGLAMLANAGRYLNVHGASSTRSIHRWHADSRRKLADLVNQTEAAALSNLFVAPKAPTRSTRPRLKPVSKRR
jgi:hypothetical protein